MPGGKGVRKRTGPNRPNKARTRRTAMDIEDLLLNGPESKDDRRVPKAMKILKKLEFKYYTGQITNPEERLMTKLIGLRNRLKESNY